MITPTLVADKTSNSLVLSCDYDPNFVDMFRNTVPASDRVFQKFYKGQRNVWLIDAQYGEAIASLCEEFFGSVIYRPATGAAVAHTEQRILEVRYIGITKDRGGNDRSAMGNCNDSWSVVFPEAVLRSWFDAPAQPTDSATLYQVLSVKQAATADEIKTAYRRLAKQWHPDVCKEVDAENQFKSINAAYQILSDPNKRMKYDAGLALEASLGRKQEATIINNGYRSPLRCGLIIAEGKESLGRFVVSKILAWEDITNGFGQTLVVSWIRNADTWREDWV
jgi:DnaJ-domain-containing protein 1